MRAECSRTAGNDACAPNGTSRKYWMAHAEDGRAYARVALSLCGHDYRSGASVSGAREFVAAANVDCHSLRLRWAAQLVRSALLPHASAGALWSFAQLLHRGVRGNRIVDAGVRVI